MRPILLLLACALPATAGPFLHRQTAYSAARSTAECNGFARQAAAAVAASTSATVWDQDDRLIYTPDSTLFVECIFVGRSEQRDQQWIYYITSASLNEAESLDLLGRLASQAAGIVPID